MKLMRKRKEMMSDIIFFFVKWAVIGFIIGWPIGYAIGTYIL